ncbi:family 10 glycosylhydrolase [Galbibacter sp.]|uniref:family 10 glycosylhydrolase n=1 Tax=Galbibacter sp. TaxID=2918471 RepID=UPI003A92C8FB
MKTNNVLTLILAVVLLGCQQKQPKEAAPAASTMAEVSGNEDFKYWTWITADANRDDSTYVAEFSKYKNSGIDAVLINTGTDPELLGRLTPLAKQEGLEVHAWIMAMNRPGDSVALQHPEWYAVSRDGNSCFDHRPYVDYYQWLCPTRKPAREHVLHLVEELAKVNGIETVHLDYIRYSDIFLPVGLLPKYDLKQETELPEFDFCYCDVCVSEFEKIHHKNPRELSNPAVDMEWKQFRLNQIKAVVDDAYDIVHKHGKKLSAAVFPYPEMADHMVRQRWDKWNIDMVLPMIYHNFYNEEVDWIGFATKQGVEDLKGSSTSLHTGIFVPPMTADQVVQAIVLAKENGAKGISFFDGNSLTTEQLHAIKATK